MTQQEAQITADISHKAVKAVEPVLPPRKVVCISEVRVQIEDVGGDSLIVGQSCLRIDYDQIIGVLNIKVMKCTCITITNIISRYNIA